MVESMWHHRAGGDQRDAAAPGEPPDRWGDPPDPAAPGEPPDPAGPGEPPDRSGAACGADDHADGANGHGTDEGTNGHASGDAAGQVPGTVPVLVHVGLPGGGEAARCGADDGMVAAWERVADPDDPAYFTCDACLRDIAEGRRDWL